MARNKQPIAHADMLKFLTERNLEWHQDHFDHDDDYEDPVSKKKTREKFHVHTPFISTTAGTIERRKGQSVTRKAFDIALRFATGGLTTDGYLFYCDLFVLGRPIIELQPFSEELRELNIHPRHSANQIEGEILAKIFIPPANIERADFFIASDVNDALSKGQTPAPDQSGSLTNKLYVDPALYCNLRAVIS